MKVLKTIRVDFCDTFPSISHPFYAEIQDDNGQVYYWNAFRDFEEMEDSILSLFYDKRVIFHKMRTKKA